MWIEIKEEKKEISFKPITEYKIKIKKNKKRYYYRCFYLRDKGTTKEKNVELDIGKLK
jgi:hypothetical protein